MVIFAQCHDNIIIIFVPTVNVTDIDIKLEKSEGDSTGQGRVLVGLNGAWGAICYNGWDLNDAHVVCRQLGFANAIRATNRANYGTWTGRIWLRSLGCTGSEDSLLDCTHDGWGIPYYIYPYYWRCDRNRLASVTCNGESTHDLNYNSSTIHVIKYP